MIQSRPKFMMRPAALLVSVSLLAPVLSGCGGSKDNSNIPPPVTDTGAGRMNGAGNMNNTDTSAAPKKPGMSTGKKVVIALAGAALLYYLYKHHVEQNGQKVQYYKSKATGQIYYRDPKTHQAHFVTPLKQELPADEAQELSKYQGYNNGTAGQDYQGTADPSGSQ